MADFQSCARYVAVLLADGGSITKQALVDCLKRDFRMLDRNVARVLIELELGGVIVRSTNAHCYSIKPGFVFRGHEPSNAWCWPHA